MTITTKSSAVTMVILAVIVDSMMVNFIVFVSVIMVILVSIA